MSFYNFVNKGEKEADLYITGDIVDNDDSWLYDFFEKDCAAPKKFKTELAEHNGKRINLYIDSYGGNVFAAASIYTMLMQHKGGVTAKISSIAASAASVIAMAADKVLMSPTAMMMIHNPATQIGGDQHDLRHAADILDGIKESIINAYERKTHLSREKISKLMDKESWFDYHEAKELGFCDGVLGDEKADNFFNKATLNSIKNQRIAVFNSLRRIKAQEEGESGEESGDPAPATESDPAISRVVIGGEDTRNVTVGDEDITLTATVYYDNDEEATEGFTLLWNSSNSDVATVSDGVVSIVAAGEATITVTVEGTDISDSVTFTVTETESAPEPDEQTEEELVQARLRKAKYFQARAKYYSAEPQETTSPPLNSKDKFSNFGEQIRAIVAAGKSRGRNVDPRLLKINNEIKGANTETDEDGGYAVQSDFIGNILDRAFERSEIVNRCSTYTVTSDSNRVNYVTLDDGDDAENDGVVVSGGIQAYWVKEGETVTPTKPKIKATELKLSKIMGVAYVTEEAMSDISFMSLLIEDSFSDAVAGLLTDGVLNGQGEELGQAKQPIGVLTSNALVTVEPADSSKLTYTDFLNMKARFNKKNWANAVWYIHPDLEAELPALTDESGNQVYIPATGISGSQYDTILGRPVVFDEYLSAKGSVGDVLLADFGEYMLIKKGQERKDWSIHVEFLTDQQCFRIIMRVNGAPIRNNTYAIRNSENRRGVFVALGERKDEVILSETIPAGDTSMTISNPDLKLSVVDGDYYITGTMALASDEVLTYWGYTEDVKNVFVVKITFEGDVDETFSGTIDGTELKSIAYENFDGDNYIYYVLNGNIKEFTITYKANENAEEKTFKIYNNATLAEE